MKKYNITVNGTTYEVFVEEADASGASIPTPSSVATIPTVAPTVSKPLAKTANQSAGQNKVTSPMPGTILAVKVNAGQTVKKGDTICVLEAMKMENDIPAPCDGTVVSVNVQKGASVNAGDVIATIN